MGCQANTARSCAGNEELIQHHHFILSQKHVLLFPPEPLDGVDSHALAHVSRNEAEELICLTWSFVFTQSIEFRVTCNLIYTGVEVETAVQRVTGLARCTYLKK